jgi:hypothetical protein
MILKIFKPDIKRIAIFAVLMIILLGGAGLGLHLMGDIQLPQQVYHALDSLHLIDSLGFLSEPEWMLTNFILVILRMDVSSVNHLKPFSLGLDAVYFWIMSCCAAYLWEKKGSKEVSTFLRPDKNKIIFFVFLLAYAAFTVFFWAGGALSWGAGEIIERTYPLSFEPLTGILFMITVPAGILFSNMLAVIVIFTGYDVNLLHQLEWVYVLIVLITLYITSCAAAYAQGNRKNRSVILITALYLLLITATPLLVQYNPENEPTIFGDSEKCTSNETEQLLVKCWLLTDEGERVYCLSQTAIKSGCNVVCASIKDINLREVCQMGVAGTTNNASICEGMRPDYKDNCYSEVGLATKDLSICEKINDSDMRDKCYSDVAIYRRDTSICDKTKIPGEKDWCVERIAVAKKDPELCDRIENGGNLSYYGQPNATLATRDLCYGATAEVTKDVSLCGKIDPENQNMIDFCYEWVGIAKGDPLLCSKINGGPGRDRCYSGVAESKQNISDCDNVVQENRNACYLAAAKATKNLSMCEKIPLAYKKDECYSAVGVELEDVSICSGIDTPYQKDVCYSRIAKRTRDLDLCKKITDLYNRETCYKEIGL